MGITRAFGRVVVTPHGALDREAVPLMRHVLTDLIDDQGNLDVVIDARHIVAIDTAVVEVLIDTAQHVGLLGGTLEIATQHEEVRAQLEGLRLRLAS